MAGKPDEPRIEPIELVTNEPEAHSEGEVSTSPSSRRWVLLGAAVMVAAAVAVLLTGGGSTDEATPDTTTTSAPDTAAPAPGDTAPPALAPFDARRGGPLLGRRFDASLLIGGGEDPWRLVDLSSGTIRPVHALDEAPVHTVLPIRRGVAILERPFEMPALVRLPVSPDGALDHGAQSSVARFAPEIDEVRLDGTVVGLLPGGDADHLWILHLPLRPPSGARMEATLVTVGGTQVAGPVPILGTPVATTSRHVVFDAGGRTYLAGEDGVRDLGAGTAFDASVDTVARVGCDPNAICFAETVDVETGEARIGSALSTQAASDERVSMVLSSQGGLATVAGFEATDEPGSTPPVQMLVRHPEGAAVAIELPSLRAEPAWLPDGSGLVVLTDIGIQHVSIEGELLAMRRIDDFDVGDATTVLVIPH